jgi:hypothetical protein
MFGMFKKKPLTMMDAFIHTIYGPNPPRKSADLERSITIAHEDLLFERVALSEVKEKAGELFKGPIPYSTHDLAVSTALGFFKSPNYVPALQECQLHARLRVVNWAKDGKVVKPLALSFEEVLYKLFKPRAPEAREQRATNQEAGQKAQNPTLPHDYTQAGNALGRIFFEPDIWREMSKLCEVELVAREMAYARVAIIRDAIRRLQPRTIATEMLSGVDQYVATAFAKTEHATTATLAIRLYEQNVSPLSRLADVTVRRLLKPGVAATEIALLLEKVAAEAETLVKLSSTMQKFGERPPVDQHPSKASERPAPNQKAERKVQDSPTVKDLLIARAPPWDRVAPDIVKTILAAITDKGLLEAFVMHSMNAGLVARYEALDGDSDPTVIRAQISQILCETGNRAIPTLTKAYIVANPAYPAI